ncbi:L,D-transpeptidase [Candidatus Magnetaquicoccus inordinatus]|uniref:L,D-transpeptidase n=1 Tax=Candidatus Magnetaquicoccus inordinatus TaxID=2496818 RepID=UPI00102AEFFC|nr:L,D-transpeptidase [Candidatus Magnetaquicoccus inordinatus]
MNTNPSGQESSWLAKARTLLQAAGWNGLVPALLVDGTRQRLYLLPEYPCPENSSSPCSWPISTASNGFGNIQDSGCTPTGLHRIAACIGAGEPCGMLFKSRIATGEIIPEGSSPVGDCITTRILWLEGLEEGINRGQGCDSKARYIYIHGTPHSNLLGQPASAGCVRMHNQDILTLFERVQEGTLVWIDPG